MLICGEITEATGPGVKTRHPTPQWYPLLLLGILIQAREHKSSSPAGSGSNLGLVPAGRANGDLQEASSSETQTISTDSCSGASAALLWAQRHPHLMTTVSESRASLYGSTPLSPQQTEAALSLLQTICWSISLKMTVQQETYAVHAITQDSDCPSSPVGLIWGESMSNRKQHHTAEASALRSNHTWHWQKRHTTLA